jgi:CheY-like chemotaxis protein
MTEKMPILLVEDDVVDARTVERALRELNVTNPLLKAGDGEEALALLGDGKKPGLILLDLNMPRMDGLEFLQELKKDPALQAIPVVILTTSESEQDIEYAYTIQPKDSMIVAIRNMIKGDPSVAQADNLKIEMSSSQDLLTKKLNESLYHFYNNRFDEVLRTCEEVLKIDPKNTTAMMRMGSAYYMVKDYSNAKLQWQHILEIEPENAEAQTFLLEIDKLLEQQ